MNSSTRSVAHDLLWCDLPWIPSPPETRCQLVKGRRPWPRPAGFAPCSSSLLCLLVIRAAGLHLPRKESARVATAAGRSCHSVGQIHSHHEGTVPIHPSANGPETGSLCRWEYSRRSYIESLVLRLTAPSIATGPDDLNEARHQGVSRFSSSTPMF